MAYERQSIYMHWKNEIEWVKALEEMVLTSYLPIAKTCEAISIKDTHCELSFSIQFLENFHLLKQSYNSLILFHPDKWRNQVPMVRRKPFSRMTFNIWKTQCGAVFSDTFQAVTLEWLKVALPVLSNCSPSFVTTLLKNSPTVITFLLSSISTRDYMFYKR